MAVALLFTLMINFVFVLGGVEVVSEPASRADDHTYLDVYANAISKAHYNPWACNYFREPGYRCLSCKSALHCYPGNFALLVQCAGLFPFCRNGYCSRYKEGGCIEDEGSDTQVHHAPSTMPPYVAGSSTNTKNKTENAYGGNTPAFIDLIDPAPEDIAPHAGDDTQDFEDPLGETSAVV